LAHAAALIFLVLNNAKQSKDLAFFPGQVGLDKALYLWRDPVVLMPENIRVRGEMREHKDESSKNLLIESTK